VKKGEGKDFEPTGTVMGAFLSLERAEERRVKFESWVTQCIPCGKGAARVSNDWRVLSAKRRSRGGGGGVSRCSDKKNWGSGDIGGRSTTGFTTDPIYVIL